MQYYARLCFQFEAISHTFLNSFVCEWNVGSQYGPIDVLYRFSDFFVVPLKVSRQRRFSKAADLHQDCPSFLPLVLIHETAIGTGIVIFIPVPKQSG